MIVKGIGKKENQGIPIVVADQDDTILPVRDQWAEPGENKCSAAMFAG